jgi:ketosteroid isomerase-like protein
MKTHRLLLGVIAVMVTGCGVFAGGIQREPIPASATLEDQARCETIARAHTEFWSAHDTDLFDEVYTEDVVHDDGEDPIVGADDVSSMANNVLMFFPKLQTRARRLYTAGGECLGVYEYFPLNLGGYDFTEDDPLIEIDLLRARDDRIFYWALFEDHPTIEKQNPDEEAMQYLKDERDLLDSYAAAWSSGEMDQVADLYASGATREDVTFGERQDGIKEIRSFSRSFFKQYPAVQWDLETPFSGDISSGQVAGGTYTIRLEGKSSESCAIEAAVLLWRSGQEILKESIFYDADSLIECGWAE